MDFRFTEQEEALRQEIGDFLERELPPGVEFTGVSANYELRKEFNRKVGERGWLAMAWPEEYGGKEASPFQQIVFMEEMAYHRAGGMSVGATWVGPTILMHGTEEQKKRYLPGIASGEIEVCLGYSEPEAGSDLASLRTRAVEGADCYVINGQKVWTSLAQFADYCWLAARTDPDVPKHRGISMFMVDMKTPGITIHPLYDIRGVHIFNEVFFDNVRVPKDCLIGGKNRGWYIIMTALNIERTTWGGGANNAAVCQRLLDEIVEYVNETKVDGKALAEDPLIQNKLAQIAIEIEITRLLAYRSAWMQTKGIVPIHESSISKVYGSEMQKHLGKMGMEILGLYGQLQADSKWSFLKGHLLEMFLFSIAWSIGAGPDEIEKNMIATRALGLPRQG